VVVDRLEPASGVLRPCPFSKPKKDSAMTSPSDITKTVRKRKLSKRGTPRKNAVRIKGSTPALFELNKPTPNEKK
jgi:hypothetical protein